MDKIEGAIKRINDPEHAGFWRMAQQLFATLPARPAITGKGLCNATADVRRNRFVGFGSEVIARFFSQRMIALSKSACDFVARFRCPLRASCRRGFMQRQ